MKFILTTGWEDGVAALTERLVHELADGRKVLWLVSGGSNIRASVQVMDNISDELAENLNVMLIDERYGRAGHADSNWDQLLKTGFKGGAATLLPILHEGIGFEPTVEHYNRLVVQTFNDNDVIIAQAGMGADGHMAGILPGSPATAETDKLVIGYHREPYTRLTLTFAALRRVSAAYVFAFGKAKHKALQALQGRSLPLDEQPAQILKELPEVYIYNDQIGDKR